MRAGDRLPHRAAGLFREPPPLWAPPALAAGARPLVLGCGGGCDVFAAYALAQIWSRISPGVPVLYGNSIGARPLDAGHTELAPHLWTVPPEPRPLQPGEEGYGTTLLEQSVPRGPEQSPVLFMLPHGQRDDDSGADDVPRFTAANSAAVHGALRALGVTEVLAVDCGGDVLTGGLDFSGDIELGRDRQVLKALQTCGLPYTLLVLGPGCDAESSVAAMTAAVRAVEDRGELLGVLPLDELAPAAAALAAGLSPSRTPNLMNAAVQRQAATSPAAGAADEEDMCTISRHGNSATVPWAWIRLGVAIRGTAS